MQGSSKAKDEVSKEVYSLNEGNMNRIYAGIEGGGTKFICAIGTSDGKILQRTSIPTSDDPKETFKKVVDFLMATHKITPLSAIGLAMFGPIDINTNSPDFGVISSTPKAGWDDFNPIKYLRESFKLPIGLALDVGAAALGEYRFGSARDVSSFVYWTVGTGIGAGVILSGRIVHDLLLHPEMGHTFIPHDKSKDPFPGVCPFHGDCLEGLATGPALEKRWGVKPATDLPPDHKAWDLEAEYLSYAMANCIMSISPQRIILGGGVMQMKQLFPKIRKRTVELLNGYIKHPAILEDIDNYIVPTGLGNDSGVCGAIALAEEVFLEEK